MGLGVQFFHLRPCWAKLQHIQPRLRACRPGTVGYHLTPLGRAKRNRNAEKELPLEAGIKLKSWVDRV